MILNQVDADDCCVYFRYALAWVHLAAYIPCFRGPEGGNILNIKLNQTQAPRTAEVVCLIYLGMALRGCLLWWSVLWPCLACALLAASAFNSLPFELINQTAPAVLAVS
jgi:hypothetical protein